MGARKRLSAESFKEARKSIYDARLMNCPISARKMRPVAELVRGMEVERALVVLQTCSKSGAEYLYKLTLSAINNWQNKTSNAMRVEEAGLFIKSVAVNQGRAIKRFRTAPQGRAHRIRKESNHVILTLGTREEKSNVENN